MNQFNIWQNIRITAKSFYRCELRQSLVIIKRIKFSHDRRATAAPRTLRPNHRRLDAVKRSQGMTKNEVSIFAPRRQLLIALSTNDDRAVLVYVC